MKSWQGRCDKTLVGHQPITGCHLSRVDWCKEIVKERERLPGDDLTAASHGSDNKNLHMWVQFYEHTADLSLSLAAGRTRQRLCPNLSVIAITHCSAGSLGWTKTSFSIIFRIACVAAVCKSPLLVSFSFLELIMMAAVVSSGPGMQGTSVWNVAGWKCCVFTELFTGLQPGQRGAEGRRNILDEAVGVSPEEFQFMFGQFCGD